MNNNIFKRQLESLRQEKQREMERYNRVKSDLAKRKLAETERHNRIIQNINNRIEQLKNSKRKF